MDVTWGEVLHSIGNCKDSQQNSLFRMGQEGLKHCHSIFKHKGSQQSFLFSMGQEGLEHCHRNTKAPNKLFFLEWDKKAWSTVTYDVIVHSFKDYGIQAC